MRAGLRLEEAVVDDVHGDQRHRAEEEYRVQVMRTITAAQPTATESGCPPEPRGLTARSTRARLSATGVPPVGFEPTLSAF